MPVTGTFGALNYSRVSLGEPNLQYWGFQFFASNSKPFFINEPYIGNDYSIISGTNFTNTLFGGGNVLYCKIDGLTNPSINYNVFIPGCQVQFPSSVVLETIIFYKTTIFDPTYDTFAIIGGNTATSYTNNNHQGFQIVDRQNGNTTSTGTIFANSGIATYNYSPAPNSKPFTHVTRYIANTTANYQNFIVEFNQQYPNPVAFRSINLSNTYFEQSQVKTDFVFMDDPIISGGKANLVCAFIPKTQANSNANSANMLVLTKHNWTDMTVIATQKAYTINPAEITIVQFNTENVYSNTSPFYLMTPVSFIKFHNNLVIDWLKSPGTANTSFNGFSLNNGNVLITTTTTANNIPRGQIIKVYGANGNTIWSTQLSAFNPVTGNTSNTTANKLMGTIGSDGNMYLSFCTTFSNVSNSNVFSSYYLKLYSNGNTFSGNSTENYTFPGNYKLQYAKTNVSLGGKIMLSNTTYTLPTASSWSVVNRANNFPETTLIVNTNKTNLNP